MTPRHARQLDRLATLVSYIAVSEGLAGEVDLEERLLDESQRLHDAVEMREVRSEDPLTGIISVPSSEMQAWDGIGDLTVGHGDE